MANNSSAKKSSGSTSGSRRGTSAAKTSSLRTRSAGRSSGRRSSGKSSQRAKEPQGIPMKREIQLVASFGIMLILMLSNFGLCGVVGVWLSSFFFGIFGCVQYVMPVAFFLMVTVLLANDYSLLAMKKCGAGFVVLTMISAYAQLIYQQDVREFYDLFAVAAADHRAGGILGGGIGLLLQSAFGVPGAIVIISCVLLLSLILLTQRSFVGFFRQGMKQVQAAWKEGVQRHRQAAKERETAEDRLREKQCEEKIKEMEEKKAEKAAGKAAKAEKPAEDGAPSGEPLTGREQSGRRMARKKKQPDIRIHIPLFAPEDEVKKKDSLKELHPEFYPFTAEDGKTEAFAGTLDFSTLSLHPEDSDETFADEAPEESRMGNTATFADNPAEESQTGSTAVFADETAEENRMGSTEMFADNPAQENRTGKAAIVADDDGEETEEAAQPETAHGLPEEITLSEQLPIEERNTAAVTAADSDIFAVTDAEQSETGYEAVRDLSPVNTDAGDPAPGDVVVATVDRRESAGDAADNRNTVRTDIPENVAPETPASSADTSVVSTGTGAEKAGEVHINRAKTPAPVPERRPAKKEEYIFPPMNLLVTEKQKLPPDYDKTLKETAMKLQSTLESFGVRVTITDISCGPTVTRYEMFPEQGTKVSKILSLTDDIKLNLAASDIRIEAPIPGKAAIGIEVPNKQNMTVHFRELVDNRVFRNFKSKLAFAVGKDIGGKIVVADLAKMPHLLIAGATGSGKSVCINTLIMSILYKAKPSEVKLIMIDPKMVELSTYNGIPHLLIPVVTDPKKASGALNWAVAEMTDRYKKFTETGVRNIEGYNKKVDELVRSGEVDGEKLTRMPQIVIIIDELADLMMVAPGEVEDAIVRLSQLARAAGIHLVIATQRPSVNVITGLIKANVPSRIAFSVSSGVDSRTIIDMNGAEKLLGKGDMLFYPSGYQKPVRVQGAFVSDAEVSRVVEFLKENEDVAVYDTAVSEKIEKKIKNGSITSERDEYFEAAARFIMEKDKATIGMLQRMFKIGFNRAARIIDQLADAGIVGPEEGTKPRKILMSPEQLDAYFEENL